MMRSKLAVLVLVAVGLLSAFSAYAQAPGTIFNVRTFGAVGDGVTSDTDAIVKAIKACSANGGGTVLFPPGKYVTGTFELLSNINLHVEAGAVILGSPKLEDYGDVSTLGIGKGNTVNISGEGNRLGIIFARNVENISITGAGAIDGRGDDFMDLDVPHAGLDFDPQYARNPEGMVKTIHDLEYGPVEPKGRGAGRPGTMIIFAHAKNVTVRDITLRNAPNWTMHLQNTERAALSGFHIINNPLIPNNDGIDCIGCKHVHISDCDIHAGDDDFAIFGSEDVNISNCSIYSRSAAIRLEDTRFSTFENLTIEANRGIGIFHRGNERTDSVLFSNIAMRTELMPGHWWGKAEPIYTAVSPCAEDSCTGVLRNVTFSNITATAESGIMIYGAEKIPVEGLVLDQVRLRMKAPRASVAQAVGGNFDLRWTARELKDAIFKHDTPALYCRWVEGMKVRDLQVQWEAGMPEYFSDGIECENFRGVDISGFEGGPARASGAAISLSNGSNVSVAGSRIVPEAATFMRTANLTGRSVLLNNDTGVKIVKMKTGSRPRTKKPAAQPTASAK